MLRQKKMSKRYSFFEYESNFDSFQYLKSNLHKAASKKRSSVCLTWHEKYSNKQTFRRYGQVEEMPIAIAERKNNQCGISFTTIIGIKLVLLIKALENIYFIAKILKKNL